MAVNSKTFYLTAASYQDISEGYEMVAFRIPFQQPRANVVRVHLGTTQPDSETDDHDEFMSPQIEEEERQVHFTALTAADRVYARGSRVNVTLRVYRK